MSSKRVSARMRRIGTWGLAAAASLAAAITFTGSGSAQTTQGRIAFDRNGAIWTMNADGTNQKLVEDYFIGGDPSLSPDGQRIVFTCGADGPTEICAVDAAGGAVSMLTATGDNTSPAFSPDGQKVAFVSRRGGSADIYVMAADGSGVTQVATGDTGSDD